MKAGTIITSSVLEELFLPIVKSINALDPTKIKITTGQLMFVDKIALRDVTNVSSNQYVKNSTEPDGTDILYSIQKDIDIIIGG